VWSHSKNSVIGLKAGKTCALTVSLMPLPLGVEGHALAFMIMVDGVGVGGANWPLVMEK
jgi:hypothetical protein